ncbi:MAG: SAM-dependent methyltransferase [Ignavibacteria bacterium]
MDDDKERFIEKLISSVDNDSFIKIKLGKYKGDDKEFENIFVSKILTNEGPKLSFKMKYTTRDIVKNYDFDKGIRLVNEILGKDFLSATLFTTENDFNLDHSKKRIATLYIKKPSLHSSEIQPHNKVKSRFVNAGAKYFHLLGITSSDGKIKADKYDKFRQVDKFIEIVDSLYRSSGLLEKDEIKIIDMGSGKSYLTFAVYDYFSNTLHKKLIMKGVEQRDELVELSNKIAGECEFTGLSFENVTIEKINMPAADITIALHACDTATDDAIYRAIQAGSEIIILAPCCQKYVRKKMQTPEMLKGIFRHGILEERLAVALTDGLRALTLENFGYDTKIFEFISSEHTAKNTMIAAVKNKGAPIEKLEEIKMIKDQFRLDDFYLDKKLL